MNHACRWKFPQKLPLENCSVVMFEPSNIVSLEAKNLGKRPGNHFHFASVLKS